MRSVPHVAIEIKLLKKAHKKFHLNCAFPYLCHSTIIFVNIYDTTVNSVHHLSKFTY